MGLGLSDTYGICKCFETSQTSSVWPGRCGISQSCELVLSTLIATDAAMHDSDDYMLGYGGEWSVCYRGECDEWLAGYDMSSS
jgi:hypothetical protein